MSRGHALVHDVLVALALVLVIEGIWPFLNPDGFRRVLLLMAAEDKRALRIAGLASMLAGVGLLYLVN
ncbi:DUF2065 domain-containing protein [Thiocapsa marina]|uniref:DUF2065 domain-containing protein n=1 Tax=Thiocapsa marina 5811 TaxID=768671 RepID=F9UFT1_9GAMM|nr:DUF2065 domain-containing protein [Thiocapsa marina]EGV16955.1 Protein of unknown function DUF2065 [Thiocapsa marina 5811]